MIRALENRLLRGLAVQLAPPLPPPSPREERAIAALRERFGSGDTGAQVEGVEEAWAENARRLRELVLTRDPREFLRWDVVRATMFVAYERYVIAELGALRRRDDWARRWRPALREVSWGRPPRCPAYPLSSSNLIHHAYHLSRLEAQTGRPIERSELVVEIGGGFGGMCRLVHALGFRGRYVIFDLPSFSALQRFYLEGVGVPVVEAAGSDAGAVCVSSLAQLDEALGAGSGGALIATWSLSETPRPLREALVQRFERLDSLLIAYQERFGTVDNLRYFAELRGQLAAFRFEEWEIPHLRGNRYLIGQRASARPASRPPR